MYIQFFFTSVLAAYDLGAPGSLIQTIYDDEAKIQRPIDLKLDGAPAEASPKPGAIGDDNWTKWLGDARCVLSPTRL